MKFTDFESIISTPRISRYLIASANDTRKAMTLYRKNLRLSQELFTVVGCFEIALRNNIDAHYTARNGNDWLRGSADAGGMFDNRKCRKTRDLIRITVRRLDTAYTHHKLIAEMDFGFWRYLFAQPQFRAGGQSLLQIFPAKPISTPAIQYNHSFVFNELAKINDLRNRIAHHEPICFLPTRPTKDTTYARQHYNLILQLFQWMSVNESALLYGLDHIISVCDEIDAL